MKLKVGEACAKGKVEDWSDEVAEDWSTGVMD
jgi:hypothetical protein